MSSRVARVLTMVGMLGVMIVIAPPAGAHSALVRMDPADGTTVRVAPPAVHLVFTEALASQYQVVSVTAPNGSPVTAGLPTVRQAVLRQPLRPLTIPGRYVVLYRAAAADGHLITDRLSFTYAPAAAASASGATSTPSSGSPSQSSTSQPSTSQTSTSQTSAGLSTGTTIGLVVLPACLLLGAGVLLWRWRRRRVPA